jgi:hypothetical protein
MNSKRLLLALLICLFFQVENAVAQIYVSTSGNDGYAGTKDQPVASLNMALRKARELRRLHDPQAKSPIHIVLKGGTYFLEETVLIRPEDSGTEQSPTIIEAAPNEHPILSGGVPFQHWKKLEAPLNGLPSAAQGKIWVADLQQMGIPQFPFRQLWINGQKAIRAKNTDGAQMQRILSWNKKDQSCWVPWPKTQQFQPAMGMEMLIHQWWEIALLRIKSIRFQGDSAQLRFMQPESRIQSEHPWPAPWISQKTGNSAFYLSNSIQFLDQPGEWFLDQATNKLYYWPRQGEELNKAQVIAPHLETLVQVIGSADRPVQYIQFKGLSFEHTGWIRPSLMGHVPHQAGLFMLDAYSLKIPGTELSKTLENQAWVGRPAAAVKLNFANHTQIGSCRFEHLASTGLDYEKGANQDLIQGNLFKDIGGTALLLGHFSDPSFEIHLPYLPKDEREISQNLQVRNNLINNATNEDWGAVGIAAGYVRGIQIEHNDISDVGNTGISLGWGWTRLPNAMKENKILSNRIHHYAKQMYDVAAIYTQSAQPGTQIKYNVADSIYQAPYAHDPEHWFYYYTDEGSSGFLVKDNWSPSDKFLQNNNGPNNHWENNGPQVSDSIKQAAGLETPYQYLLAEKTAINPAIGINHASKPTVVELILEKESAQAKKKFEQICVSSGFSKAAIYQFKTHLLLYANMEQELDLLQTLQQAFPKARIKSYRNPLYDFVREQKCQGVEIAKDWKHIILTANLVQDTAMQRAYKDYHATQFKYWPEVSKGFCNAEFQQLQVFENNRQLILIISIPKDKTLDELNPKTTKDNPRVDEWNKIMQQYQEAIPEAPKGSTWVFFNQLNQSSN